jgi:predicted lipoprotein with Yx(FWY)xxD motif
MKNMVIAVTLLLLAGALLLAGCTRSQTAPVTLVTPVPTASAATTPTPMPDSIRVMANPLYGQILTDMHGMTLYYFLKDTPGNGTSACTGACTGIWPAFNTATIQVSPPLQVSDFGTFTRSDGATQIMYRGWPLYYYSGDKAPGDANGYGFNKLWYVVSPTGVVTLAPTTTIPTTKPTTVPTTVPTTAYHGGGGY